MKSALTQLKNVSTKILTTFSGAWSLYSYLPDLIVEVTDACDRSCPGCYAPNILIKPNSKILPASKFLSPQQLAAAFDRVDGLQPGAVISFRGGEPTLSPYLDELLELAISSNYIPVLETHGRWILSDEITSKRIIDICLKNGSILKISADSMHRINHTQTNQITNILRTYNLNYIFAVTCSEEQLIKELTQLQISHSEEIIFQPIATSEDYLVSPPLGVIDTTGHVREKLTNIFPKIGSVMMEQKG